MVEDVEEFRAELDALGFLDRNVLENREVPLLVRRTCDDVASFVAELSGLRDGIETLEGAGVEPFLWRARAGVGISDEIGPVAGEA